MERRALSMWWDQSTWDLARAAFVAGLDDEPPGPDTLLGWIVESIEAHTARSAASRAALGADLPPYEGSGFQRVHQLPGSVVVSVDAAIDDDRRSAGRMLSRSAWVREAAQLAAAQTRKRRGDLPDAPARLSPGPARRR